MEHCQDCEFFVPMDASDVPHPTLTGRCGSPMFGGMRPAFVTGDNKTVRTPCRMHTKEY